MLAGAVHPDPAKMPTPFAASNARARVCSSRPFVHTTGDVERVVVTTTTSPGTTKNVDASATGNGTSLLFHKWPSWSSRVIRRVGQEGGRQPLASVVWPTSMR